MTDLISTLRALSRHEHDDLTIGDEAAYEIARLRVDHAAAMAAMDAKIERLRAALAKIADWDSNWGPFPENNEAWRAMVVVTAREAVPELEPNGLVTGCRMQSG